jgi:acetyltransferase-like isoleucine patch superfamily enzyme
MKEATTDRARDLAPGGLPSRLPIYGMYALYRAKCMPFGVGSRLLAMVPGLLGVRWRMHWYRLTLEHCGPGLYVDWMSVIKTANSRIGENVFIGPFCWIGWSDIGDNVLLGGQITVLTGSRHHNFDRADVPINQQGGTLSQIRIGADVWVGNGAIIMADIAPGSVVAAGAVVTKTFEPSSLLAGVPARFIRRRGETEAGGERDEVEASA